MKLLINADVIRSQAIEVIRNEKNSTILKIKYFENKVQKEYLFEIPYNIMYRLQLINGLSKIESKDGCKFVYAENDEDQSVYAILHSEELYPSDVFVPINKKENVKVLKKFKYPNYNIEYGNFVSTIYFVKLKIEDQKTLAIYMGPKDSKMQNKNFELYRYNESILVKRKWNNNSKSVCCISLSKL